MNLKSILCNALSIVLLSSTVSLAFDNFFRPGPIPGPAPTPGPVEWNPNPAPEPDPLPPPPPPGPGHLGFPSQVRFIERAATSLTFEWQDTSSGEVGYRVYRQPEGGTEILAGTIGAVHIVGGFTDTGLEPDTQYCYRVEAFNADGDILPSAPNCGYTNRSEHEGALVKRLRVLTHNVYGFKKSLLAHDCDTRFSTLGESIAIADPPYDIVGMQEHYRSGINTCNPGALREGIESTGRYLNDSNRYRFKPDSSAFDFDIDGGLGIYSLHAMSERSEDAWDNFDATFESPLQGVVFARIDLPGTSIAIDTYIVHTYSFSSDGCERDCLRGELLQLRDRIIERSSRSGNPVLIMGDLNVNGALKCAGAPPPEGNRASYDDIMEILMDPLDLWCANHPELEGFTSQSGKRLDYILIAQDPRLTNGPYDIVVNNRDDVQVVKWNSGFGPVSDHFGLEATIEIRQRVSGPTVPVAVPMMVPQFLRGNSNGDEVVDIGDAIWTLRHLMLGDRDIQCADAADANDDDRNDIGDAIFTLRSIILGTVDIPAPGPHRCDVDQTADVLGCAPGPNGECYAFSNPGPLPPSGPGGGVVGT
jgi:hypothetical protein